MVSKTREVGIRLSVKDKEVVERALKSLGKEGEQAFRRIEASAKPASVSLHALNAAAGTARSAIGGFVAGAIGGLLPVLTFAGALAQTKAALETFGSINDQAKASGLDVEYFQGLAYAAKLEGIEISALSGALQGFAKNAGLAAEGKGRMVTQLKALNPELLKNIQLARSQEERVRLAADAIRDAGSASEKAALGAVMFGDQGTKLVAVLEGGAAAVDATISKARELGIVVDRQVIERADELGDKLDTAAQIVDLKLKTAFVNLAPTLVWLTGLVADMAGEINALVDMMNPLQEQTTSTIETRLKVLRDSMTKPIGQGGTLAGIFDQDGTKRQIAELERELFRRADKRSVDKLAPSSSPLPELPIDDDAKASLKEAEALIKRLRTATEEYADTVADLEQKHSAGLISQETLNRGVADAALKFAKAADDADEYAAALARLDEAKAAGIISEKQYTDAVASLTQRRLVAQNDWLAGVQLGLQQISEGARNVTTEVAQAVTGWADSLGQQIGEVFRTGKFAWQDLVKTMLADIAKLVTQQMITRPLAGLLGGLFGGLLGGGGGGWNIPSSFVPGGFYPGFANGTDFAPGGMAMVGERGPELVNLPRGSRVIPNHRLGGTVVNLSATYNIDGAAGMSPAQLLAVLDQHDRDLMARVSDVVKRDAKNGVFG